MMTVEDLADRLREHNEQQLRAYIATVNLHHRLSRVRVRDGEKIRIHFLYISDVLWPVWASFYDACREDDRMETKLVFLEFAPGILPGRPSAQARDFLRKNRIPHIAYEEYDPFAERPHLLVYQIPYNDRYLHFAKLKANYIKEAGIRPVYISYGIEYDMPRTCPDLPESRLNMLHYRQYVQLFAWKVIVMHEDIRDGFYRHCLAGGSHIAVWGNPKFDAYAGGISLPAPEELRRKAAGRPMLAWQVHHFWNDFASDPARTHSLPVTRMREIFLWLREQRRVFTAVTFHPQFAEDGVQSGQATLEEIENLKILIDESPNTALYEGPYQSLLAGAEAFVTEKSSLMLEMAFLGKPTLLLQDLKVAFKPFAGAIAASFYHGEGLDDVKTFFRIVEGAAPDTLAEERKRVRAEYFSRCDGRIGERIKTYLVESLLAEQAET
ncbi:MAG: hypothetical protein LBU06_01205 [Desulfovibrio sp.]|nr:hypothetical protein [Desulfovibrio sp.]